MKKPDRLLIFFFSLLPLSSFSQKLKKADRVTEGNIQSHVAYLEKNSSSAPVAAADAALPAEKYVIALLKKAGCRPAGDSGAWLQKFPIPDGREALPSSSFLINGKPLALYTDYFAFPFSASKKSEGSVTMELAENGVPWFVDLKELLDDSEDASRKDTLALISSRAKRAATKGATALFVYNGSLAQDLLFQPMDSVQTAKIPVVYIERNAAKQYLNKEATSLEVKLDILMKERSRNGFNVIGYTDNHADSTIIASAHLDNKSGVAELLEVSRLLKGKPYRSFNYLFIVFPAENKGANGMKYFHDHPMINLQKVNYTLNMDSIGATGLPAVKQSIDLINALKNHETKARP